MSETSLIRPLFLSFEAWSASSACLAKQTQLLGLHCLALSALGSSASLKPPPHGSVPRCVVSTVLQLFTRELPNSDSVPSDEVAEPLAAM